MSHVKSNWLSNSGQNRSRSAKTPRAMTGTELPATYFGPMSQFFHEMDRMFENMFQNFAAPALFSNAAHMPGVAFYPHVDVCSTDSEYLIHVEVPGIEEKDLKLDLARDGTLTVYGEKMMGSTDQNRNYHHMERSYGSFQRTLSLPEDVEQDTLEASFHNGVLTISAQKRESAVAHSRKININSGEGSRAKHNASRSESSSTVNMNSHPKKVA